jgi:hypothetical protein
MKNEKSKKIQKCKKPINSYELKNTQRNHSFFQVLEIFEKNENFSTRYFIAQKRKMKKQIVRIKASVPIPLIQQILGEKKYKKQNHNDRNNCLHLPYISITLE